MGRPRKRHEQLSFPKRDKNGQLRGGKKRKGAGRPKKGKFASERHETRPQLSGREPLLITARVSKATANLRRRSVYQAVRRALTTALARMDFRIVHFTIQRNHLHLLAEADNKQALSRGVQGFLISAARRINAAASRSKRGSVFPDRYHERILRSPKQCRNAIRYVLNNWRRHGEDLHGEPSNWLVDPWSSAVNFAGWKRLEGTDQLYGVPEWYERPPTSTATTWLLTIGWMKHGLIGKHEVPGPQSMLV
jgi:REP element-mobilizing transposase RayT